MYTKIIHVILTMLSISSEVVERHRFHKLKAGWE